MKKILILLLLCAVVSSTQGQEITRNYQSQSLSRVLEDLNAATSHHEISFVYNDLEDFTVTCRLDQASLEDALMKVVGFYPVRIVRDGEKYFVECTHKTERHLKGRLIDNQNQPVAYANVSLLSPADSSLIGGGVSNENGDFVIPTEAYRVIVKCTFIGYKTLLRTCEVGDIGTLQLQPAEYTINGITVKGHVPQYQMGNEGLVTNVENTPLSQLGTASDVLGHVPGVIRKDNEYEVFGKGTPVIYINGRKMRNSRELEQLKSTDIKSIELVSNPGAKYDATVGAVVKIKTVRKAGDGFSIDTWARWQQGRKDQEAASLDMNYRHNGLDIFASLWASKRKNLQIAEMTQEVQADTLWQQNNDMHVDYLNRDYSIEGGFNYSLNEDNVFGAKYEYTFPSTAEDVTTLTSDVTANGQFYDRWDNQTDKRTKGSAGHKLNAYYIGKVGKMDIDFNFDYLRSGYDDQSRIVETCQVQDDRRLDAENSVRNRMVASKLTLTYPLLGGSLDFGAEYTNTKRQDDYVNPQNYVASTYSTLKEQSICPYAEYSIMLPKVGQIRAGLRYEHVNFDYYDRGQLVEAQSRSYGNLYPSVSFGTQIGKVQAQIAYSVKTSRPTYRQLSNDVFYGNRYSLQRGNPLLDNSTLHNISIQGLWKFLQFSLEYSDDRGRIIHWMEQIGNSNVVLVTYKNIPSLKWILPFVSLAPAFGIWHPNLSVGLRKQWLTMETTEGNISLDKAMPMVQMSNTFAFSKSLTGELNFYYQGTGHYQNVYLDYHQTVLNVSLVKTFFNDRLSIKLAGEDLLDRSRDGNMVYNHHIQLYQGNYFARRRFVATVRYKFNATRSKYKGTGAGNAEKSRL